MNFKQFIQNQAVADKLPFDIDVEPEPWEGEFENIGRFQLPRYDELLTREAWFFEFLGNTLGSRRVELQIEIFSLAKLIKEELGLESDSVALKTLSELTGSSAEILKEETEDERKARVDKEEQKQGFFMRHLSKFIKLGDLVKATEEGAIEAWMRITFFLLSRYSADWTFSKTASLRKSEIDALINFISQEANGGVLPQQEEETADLGKESSPSKQPELAGALPG